MADVTTGVATDDVCVLCIRMVFAPCVLHSNGVRDGALRRGRRNDDDDDDDDVDDDDDNDAAASRRGVTHAACGDVVTFSTPRTRVPSSCGASNASWAPPRMSTRHLRRPRDGRSCNVMQCTGMYWNVLECTGM